MNENSGVYIPSGILKGSSIIVAIDISNLKVYALDGKGQLQVTATEIYQ